jgi:microcompartment protein CcmK/EutM
MLIGKVMGMVVSSQKVPRFQGMKLLLVQPFQAKDNKMVAAGGSVVAADCVGAGEGEWVMFTQGSSARMTDCTKDSPTDAVIIGIVDSVEVGGKKLEKP